LTQVIQINPDNETAWLWMAAAVKKHNQKKKCLQRVLEINPDNTTARHGLAKLKALETEVEEPALEEIVAQIPSQKATTRPETLSSENSMYSSDFYTTTITQSKPSNQSGLSGQPIFLLITASFVAVVGLFLLYVGKRFEGIGNLIMGLVFVLSAFEQQAKNQGKDIFLIKALRIFLAVVAVMIFGTLFISYILF
jgi:hypothetical protein